MAARGWRPAAEARTLAGVNRVRRLGGRMTVERDAEAIWPVPRVTTRRDAAAAHAKLLFASDRGLLLAAAAVWTAMTVWKLALAATIGVVWEEAHFVVAGMHPALAYPDIPAGWPLFARLCVTLFGWSPLALRIPALAVAQAVPFAIYFLAKPVVGRRNAIWAALISILMPPLGASGAIFYSEAAMQLLLAVMLGAMIRAEQTRRLGWWLLTGIAAGLGLFVHYRFAVAGVGVMGFVLTSRAGLRLWREPGFWLAGALAAAGLAPSIAYNLVTHAPALTYHLVGQQSWRFDLVGVLVYFGLQAAICTPIFFVGMIAGALAARHEAKPGEAGRPLLLWVGGAIFGLYALISPFDQKLAPQWPIEAYVALIPFLPAALAAYVDGARSLAVRRLRMGVVALGPLILAVAFVIATLWTEVGWAHPDQVPLTFRAKITADYEPFNQFEPAIARAQAAARARYGADALLAAAGHVEAVKLEFPGRAGRQVFALGDPRELNARFDVFRAAIGLDLASLVTRHAGAPVVILLPEPTYLYDTPDEVAFRDTLCRSFTDVQPVESVEAPPGRLVMQTFIARVGARASSAPAPCPFLPGAYIDQPKRTDILRAGRTTGFSGLAANPSGVARVDILLDGRGVSQAKLGQSGPVPPALAYDPDYPNLRFSFDLPPAALTPGSHRLALRVTARDGSVAVAEARTIYGPGS
jgi:Dolichyl-phosphate-mannose-protein mannosyltransferase